MENKLIIHHKEKTLTIPTPELSGSGSKGLQKSHLSQLQNKRCKGTPWFVRHSINIWLNVQP